MPFNEEPRSFFLTRIEQEAMAEGKPLTDLERRFLHRSQGDDPEEAQRTWREFAESQNELEFSLRIQGLIQRAMDREAKMDPGAAVRYQEALRALEATQNLDLYMVCAPGVMMHGGAKITRAVFILAGVVLALVVLMFVWFAQR